MFLFYATLLLRDIATEFLVIFFSDVHVLCKNIENEMPSLKVAHLSRSQKKHLPMIHGTNETPYNLALLKYDVSFD